MKGEKTEREDAFSSGQCYRKEKIKISGVWCSYMWSRETFPSCTHVFVRSMDSVTHLSPSACLNVMSHRTSESMYQIRHLLKCFAKQKDQFTYFPQRSCKMKLNGCLVHLRRSPILPWSIHLLSFHSCTFSFGESVWETGTREFAAIEMTVLPGVADVTTTDPDHAPHQGHWHILDFF